MKTSQFLARGQKNKNKSRQRTRGIIAGAVAASLALGWAVGGVVLPSMAASGVEAVAPLSPTLSKVVPTGLTSEQIKNGVGIKVNIPQQNDGWKVPKITGLDRVGTPGQVYGSWTAVSAACVVANTGMNLTIAYGEDAGIVRGKAPTAFWIQTSRLSGNTGGNVTDFNAPAGRSALGEKEEKVVPNSTPAPADSAPAATPNLESVAPAPAPAPADSAGEKPASDSGEVLSARLTTIDPTPAAPADTPAAPDAVALDTKEPVTPAQKDTPATAGETGEGTELVPGENTPATAGETGEGTELVPGEKISDTEKPLDEKTDKLDAQEEEELIGFRDAKNGPCPKIDMSTPLVMVGASNGTIVGGIPFGPITFNTLGVAAVVLKEGGKLSYKTSMFIPGDTRRILSIPNTRISNKWAYCVEPGTYDSSGSAQFGGEMVSSKYKVSPEKQALIASIVKKIEEEKKTLGSGEHKKLWLKGQAAIFQVIYGFQLQWQNTNLGSPNYSQADIDKLISDAEANVASEQAKLLKLKLVHESFDPEANIHNMRLEGFTEAGESANNVKITVENGKINGNLTSITAAQAARGFTVTPSENACKADGKKPVVSFAGTAQVSTTWAYGDGIQTMITTIPGTVEVSGSMPLPCKDIEPVIPTINTQAGKTEADGKYTITDNINMTGLTPGKSYKVVFAFQNLDGKTITELNSTGAASVTVDGKLVNANYVTDFTADEIAKTLTFSKEIDVAAYKAILAKLGEDKKIHGVTYLLYDNNKKVVKHNTELNVESEWIVFENLPGKISFHKNVTAGGNLVNGLRVKIDLTCSDKEPRSATFDASNGNLISGTNNFEGITEKIEGCTATETIVDASGNPAELPEGVSMEASWTKNGIAQDSTQRTANTSTTTKAFTLNAGDEITLSANNAYKSSPGKIQVFKIVKDDNALITTPQKYDFNIKCGPAGNLTKFNKDFSLTYTPGQTAPVASEVFNLASDKYLCEVSEKTAAAVDGAKQTPVLVQGTNPVVGAPFTDVENTTFTSKLVPATNTHPAAVTFTNTYVSQEAGLVIKKVATLDSQALPNKFNATVKLTCTNPGAADETTEINVPFNGQIAVSEINGKKLAQGAVCTIEETDSAKNLIEGLNLKEVKLNASSGETDTNGVLKFTLPKGATTEATVVTVANQYEHKTGKFVLKKETTGDKAVAASFKFPFTVSCAYNNSELKIHSASGVARPELSDGQTLSFGTYPVGTECYIKENPLANPFFTSTLEWNNLPAGAEKQADGSIKYTVSEGSEAVTLTATNNIVQAKNSIVIEKYLEGNAKNQVRNKVFDFKLKCGSQEETLQVKGDRTVTSKEYPVNTDCTLEEVDPNIKDTNWSVTWGGDVQSSMVKDGVVSFKMPLQHEGKFTVVADNNFDKREGEFEIVKIVEAPEGDTKPANFYFSYTCSRDGEDILGVNGKRVAANTPLKVTGLPVGAECEVRETNIPKIANTNHTQSWKYKYANENGTVNLEPGATSATFVIKEGEAAKVTVTATNTYTPKNVKFTLQKEMNGTAVPSKLQSFNFAWECKYNGQLVASDYNATVIPGIDALKVYQVPANKNIRQGSTCAIWETASGIVPLNNSTHTLTWEGTGVTPKDSSYTDAKGISHKNYGEFTVGEQQIKVKATNDYQWDKAKLEIKKVVNATGGNFNPDQEFTFDLTCTHPNNTDLPAIKPITLKAGQTSSPQEVIVGSTCTVNETGAGAVGWDLNTSWKLNNEALSSNSFKIEGKNTNIVLEATNSYERKTGNFEIKKIVNKPAEGEFKLPTSYKFAYTCQPPATSNTALAESVKTGSLEVSPDGDAATSPAIPFGYVCSVKEEAPPANSIDNNLKYTGVSYPDGNTVTIGEDTTKLSITAVNTYVKDSGIFVFEKKFFDVNNNTDSFAQTPSSIKFSYTCDEGKTSIDFTLPNAKGEWKYTSAPLPTGAICTITEDADSASVAGYGLTPEWSYTVKPEVPADDPIKDKMETKTGTGTSFDQIVIGKEGSERHLTAVNKYEKKNVSLNIEKKTQGDAANSPASANFAWTCGPDKGWNNVPVAVTVGGPALTVATDIPWGATCEVWELETPGLSPAVIHNVSLSAQNAEGVEVGTPVASQDVKKAKISFEAKSETSVTVSATNTYPKKPKIGTKLADAAGNKSFLADGSVNLVDTVSYENLEAGTYKLVAKLVNKADNTKVVKTVVTDELKLSGNSGTDKMIPVIFNLSAEEIRDNPQGLTALEYLAFADNLQGDKLVSTAGENGGWVATHAPGSFSWDENAQASLEDQSVTVKLMPSIQTVAEVEGASADTPKQIAAKTAGVINDTVNYTDVEPGSYVLYGELREKASKAVVAQSQPMNVSVEAGKTTGEWKMPITVGDNALENGKSYVVFEYLLPAGTDVTDALKEELRNNADNLVLDKPVSDPTATADGKKIVAKHDDITSAEQTITTPSLETNATDENGTHFGSALDGNATVKITDKVTWTNLKPGKQYEITGTLRVKNADGSEGEELKDGGKVITATTGKFEVTAAEAKEGSRELVFEVPARLLQGVVVVAYETMTKDGIEVAVHKDITDPDQSVYYPSLETQAQSAAGTQVVEAGKQVTVVDTVAYKGLEPGKEYVIVGKLMDIASIGKTNEAVVDTAYTSLVATDSQGEAKVTFTFDSQLGKNYVVYEYLYLRDTVKVANNTVDTTGATVIGKHEDPNDEKQMVSVPSVKTDLVDVADNDKFVPAASEFKVEDTVTYTGLIPGKAYTVSGKLHIQEVKDGVIVDGGVLTDAAGNEITQTAQITAAETKVNGGNGTVKLVFTVTKEAAEKLAGRPAVAFEDIKDGEKIVATHSEINDDAQTVYTAQMKTDAQDADNDKTLTEGSETTVTDHVTFTGALKANTDYTLSGKLVDKANTNTAIATASKVLRTDATGKFPAEVTLDLKVAAGDVKAGASYVVFEYLYEGKFEGANVPTDTSKAVLDHADPTDPAQTVTVAKLETEAKVNGAKTILPEADLAKEVTIVDTVKYEGLTPGKAYTLSGSLHYKVDGTTANGKAVTKEQTVTFPNYTIGADGTRTVDTPALSEGKVTKVFTPAAANGEITMDFVVPFGDISGLPVVVFEDLHLDGILVGSHAKIDDDDQTVYSPSIGTVANWKTGPGETDLAKTIEVPKGEANLTIVDTVVWKGLEPGKSYVMVGKLMKKDGAAGTDAGLAPVTSEKFTVAKGQTQGEVKIEFSLPKAQVTSGAKFVAFEEAFEVDAAGNPTGSPVATHNNINDPEQTVAVSDLLTKAYEGKNADDKNITVDPKKYEGTVDITDEISYFGLDPAKTYTLSGTLMYQQDGVTFDGKEVKRNTAVPGGTKTVTDFKPEAANGKYLMTFTIEKKVLGSAPVVTFETLKDGELTVASHSEIDDASQTVYSPSITTKAAFDAVDGGASSVAYSSAPDAKVNIVDRVTWNNLAPGTYQVQGTLYDKASNAPLAGNYTSSALLKVVAGQTTGSVDMTFTVPMSALKGGQQLVVFEKVFAATVTEGADGTDDTVNVTDNTKPVATHEDINAESQTVTISQLETEAFLDKDGGDKSREITATGTTTIVDKVHYKGLNVGQTYVLTGSLHYQVDGKLADGREVKAGSQVKDSKMAITFVPTKSEDNAFMTFTVDNSEIAGMPVVVFEKAYLADGTNVSVTPAGGGQSISVSDTAKPVGTHEDLTAESQTVHFPKIGTVATGADGTKTLNAPKEGSVLINDNVTWQGLPAGKYVMTGKVMNKATGAQVEGVKAAPVVFEVKTGQNAGNVEVKFEVPAKAVSGGAQLVVFEKAYLVDGKDVTAAKGEDGKTDTATISDDAKPVATHEDINDPNQTVGVRDLLTKAFDLTDGDQVVDNSKEAKIVDEVSYSGLNPANKYTVNGVLMDQKTENATKFTASAEIGAGTANPIPASGTGKVYLTFTIPAGELAGTTVVVFESVSYQGTPGAAGETPGTNPGETPGQPGGTTGEPGENIGDVVLTHEDIKDKAQTVVLPKIGTEAKGDQFNKLHDGKAGVITDVVTYENLKADAKYVLQGELMDKATGESTGIKAAKTVTASDSGKGEWTLEFKVPANLVKEGKTFVAFEKVWDFDHVTVVEGKDADGKTDDSKTTVDPKPNTDGMQIPTGTPGTEEGEGTTTGPKDYQPVATHEDITDENQAVVVGKAPKLGTTLSEDGKRKPGSGLADVDLGVGSLIDVVSYEGLEKDNKVKYRLEGRIVKVAADGKVTETGVQAEPVIFTSAKGEGEHIVTFNISKLERAQGERLVAYEVLYLANEDGSRGAEVVRHEKADDIDQTVRLTKKPEIQTELTSPQSKDLVYLSAGGDTVTLTDTVTYTDLKPGVEYTMTGELMAWKGAYDKDGKRQLEATGIKGHKTFTPEAKAGEEFVSSSVEIPFTVPLSVINQLDADGNLVIKGLVAYEALYLKTQVDENGNVTGTTPGEGGSGEAGTGTTPIATHQDPDDDDQTVLVVRPDLGTVATSGKDKLAVIESSAGSGADKKDAVINDVVTYTGLVPGTKYVVVGTLMDKATNAPVPGVNNAVLRFTAAANGSGKLGETDADRISFTVPYAALKDKAQFVVFEKLYLDNQVGADGNVNNDGAGNPVAPIVDHSKLEDQAQTVTVGQPAFGEFTVTKTVSSYPEAVKTKRADALYPFAFKCIDPATPEKETEHKGEFTLKEGQSFNSFKDTKTGAIPDGYVCEVHEIVAAVETALVSKVEVKWTNGDGKAVSMDKDGKIKFTIHGSDNMAFTADNTIKYAPTIVTNTVGNGTTDVKDVTYGQTFTDVVSYSNLEPGSYVIHTYLMKWDAKANGGKGAAVELSEVNSWATPRVLKETTAKDGSWTIDLKLPENLDVTDNMKIIVWQDLYREGDFDLTTGKPVVGADNKAKQPVATHRENKKPGETGTSQWVNFVNRTASLTLMKKIVVDPSVSAENAKALPVEYNFSYNCVIPAGAKLKTGVALTGDLTVTATKTQVVRDLPIGTKCTLVEKDPTLPAGVTQSVNWSVVATGTTGTAAADTSATGAANTAVTSGQDSKEYTLVVGSENGIVVMATNTFKTPPPPPPPSTPPSTPPVTTPPSTPPPSTPPSTPPVTVPPSTPPVLGDVTTPPVKPSVILPPRQPKQPVVLVRTGASAAVFGGLAVALIGLGAGIGLMAAKRRKQGE